MTTQVNFKIDKIVKEKAQKKAKKHGSTYSAFLQQATYAFVEDDLGIGLIDRPKLNAKTLKELKKISQDIKEGKNLSPAFKSVAEMKKYLLG
jgi:antitoxin component of RelBE/YafQ-DinJ toxin-antitoxin module